MSLPLCNSVEVKESSYVNLDNLMKQRRLGNEVVTRRTALQLSQQQLALKCGLSKTTIIFIETSQKDRLRKSNVAKLERALGWQQGSVELLVEQGTDPVVIEGNVVPLFDDVKETLQQHELEIDRLKQTVDELLDALAAVPRRRRKR